MGPQALQVLLSSVDCNAGALGVAADAGVKDIKDLKGKRIGFVVGSPALNQNTLAYLAFAGLTQSDVKIVEFAGYGAMWKGLINNDTDAAFGTTITGPAKEAETSPRGLVWPPLPAKDMRRMGAAEESRHLLLPAACHLRRGDFAGEADRARQLPLSDLRRLCVATAGSNLPDRQGDDHGLRRLQGFRARRGRPRGRPANQELGGADPSGAVKALKEAGQWTAEQETYNNGSDQASGSAGGGMGGLWQIQPAFG